MGKDINLTAKFKFDADPAVRSMNKAQRGFTRLGAAGKRVKAGMKDISGAFSGSGLAITALTGGAVLAVKKFASFELAMGGVFAKLGKTDAGLTSLAEKLGSETQFTAKEAAEAMEQLAAAGNNTTQIMTKIGPVLNAAAADGIDLATSAAIVNSNMAAWGKEAGDVTNVVDTLAFVSSKTKSNMVSLQEGMKLVAPTAKAAGFGFAETTAALGALNDVGLDATMAGTALRAAINKIATGAKNGSIKVGKLSLSLKEADGSNKSLLKVMGGVAAKLREIPKGTERAAAASKLLGIRGAGAAAAFDSLTKQKTEILFKDLEKSAAGAAAKMVKLRNTNLGGSLVKAKSAADGLTNAIGRQLTPTIEPLIKRFTSFAGQAAGAFKIINSGVTTMEAQFIAADQNISPRAMAFVTGLRTGFFAIRDVVSTVGETFGWLGSMLPTGTMAFLLKTGLQLATVTLVVKGLGGAFKRVGLLARGSVGLLRGLAGGVASLGGGAGRLGKLGGLLGKVGGVASKVSDATASPVRVVNFHEMGAAKGLLDSNTPGTGGGGKGGLISKFKGAGGVKGLLKSAGGLKGLAKMAGGVAAAGAVGVAIGTALDKAFNISDRIAGVNRGHKREFGNKLDGRRKRDFQRNITGNAEKALALSKRFGGKVDFGGGKKLLTRESLTARLVTQMKQEKLKSDEQKKLLASLEGVLSQLPSAVKAGVQSATINATIGADQANKAIGGKQQESKSRRSGPGGRLGSSRGSASRGMFSPVGS